MPETSAKSKGSKPVLSDRNIMQVIYLILHFLVATFFKKVENKQVNSVLSFQHVIDIKHYEIICEISFFNIRSLKCGVLFYTSSPPQLRLARFQVLNSHMAGGYCTDISAFEFRGWRGWWCGII